MNDIPVALLERVIKAAHDQGLTVEALIVQAVDEYLRRHPSTSS